MWALMAQLFYTENPLQTPLRNLSAFICPPEWNETTLQTSPCLSNLYASAHNFTNSNNNLNSHQQSYGYLTSPTGINSNKKTCPGFPF